MEPLDYKHYFKFNVHPFRLPPDPHFFFPSEPHIKAKEVLLYGIARGEGFMVLVGEAGTGKSLLLRMLLSELPNGKETAMVVAPKVSPGGLLRLILEDLGIDGEDTTEVALLQRRIEENIIKLAHEGKELLIVIDEAQNLPLDTLEQLRLLSNIETSQKKLLQIVLVGQPELVSLINSPGLGQLAQRISIMESIRPLNLKETEDYITYRMNKGGGETRVRIDYKALRAIHKASGGIPRLINKIMDRALLVAASRGEYLVTAKVVKEALETLPDPAPKGLGQLSPRGKNIMTRMNWHVFVLPVAIALLLTGYFSPMILNHLFLGDTLQERASKAGDTIQHQSQLPSRPPLGYGVVRIKRAFVREGPGTKYPRFTVVSMGDRLVIEDKDGPWLKVKVYDARGNEKRGWIRQDLVIMER